MNRLPAEKIAQLNAMFCDGKGVRVAARTAGVHRDTAMRYRRAWIEAELQRAYDCIWEHDCEGCDAITARLPGKPVREMLDAWLDDDFNYGKPGYKPSRWH